MTKHKLLKKISALLVIILYTAPLTAQYQPNWESLDKRPVPQWYNNARFGIFIHWGVYSVPGYCGKGNYAEWYQNTLTGGDSATTNYHQKKFGDRTYYDLAKDFKAELFNPDEWAKVFEQSGAKYIVLTSKHHDGYALWPSREASRDRGFAWNASEVGPHRDLLGDLFKAVRKTSVRAGMYYSLYEWYNPLWLNDKPKYVTEHMWPQMKELVNTYQPDVIFTDGEWDAPAETWKSQEFLSWLYNESPVKDKVVTYDRWGSGIRFKHGAVYTPEYQPDLDVEGHAWEESRGMGYSYGYNRDEDAWDYNSSQSLVLQLIDKASRGGNFLLDIGPDEHGKIPPIMQERLLQIGDWLKINGEAIYGTERWKTVAQWSEGRRDYTSKSGDMLLKITLDPDPGFAVKEVFYTYNADKNDLYAILPKYPGSKKIVLKKLVIPAGTEMTFLSTKEKLLWKQAGENIEIELPEFNPEKIKNTAAYAIKIAGFGKFTSKPSIEINYIKTALQPTVAITGKSNEVVRYTTDGSEPVATSALYTKPFVLDKSAEIKAASFIDGILPGPEAAKQATRYEWMDAVKVNAASPGIAYRYFELNGKIDLNSINTAAPVKTGFTNEISDKVKQRKEKLALSFDGFIKISKSGLYTFSTFSDDGSKLFIDGVEIVNNDGEHAAMELFGKAALKSGFHSIKVTYFGNGDVNELKVNWQPPGAKNELIPGNVLFHH
ncbi:alpha-L-fucosidase [Ferruginibacter paludis]|uniref:alpha-L-fucosidase n=1 Tax=Ferruginibacter paludis TaxID=1310417 RepID=UPI0025B569AE|nr:alpha-L-fucosidase [Ferruginibacter paludis]MDN3657144.1 alpha-L-fucosidase [Ferruginibacter paludis]